MIERHTAQNDFMSERVKVMVATNAFGMGIDKANVRLVVHHTMPGSLEAYYQEAGRAGRNGQRANCVLLHAFQDRFTHEFLINNARTSSEGRSESLASCQSGRRCTPAESGSGEARYHATLRVCQGLPPDIHPALFRGPGRIGPVRRL